MFSISVFKACFEHALVNRPPADECFSGVPGHGEGHAGLADLARVVIGGGGGRPHIVVIASQIVCLRSYTVVFIGRCAKCTFFGVCALRGAK